MGNLKFDIDDTCVKCGACAVDCPVQCITKGATQFNIGNGCIGCGDCYSICPVGAVKMSPKSEHQNINHKFHTEYMESIYFIWYNKM